MSDTQSRYNTFGTVGLGQCKIMSGKRGQTVSTEIGSVVSVQNFSAGNLSGNRQSGVINERIVAAGSGPNVRAFVQAILPPQINIAPVTGNISINGSRIVSGQGVRDVGITGSLIHPAIDTLAWM